MGFGVDGSGDVDDRVRLILGDDDVRIFENYDVHTAILQQPAVFHTTLSAGKRLARTLLERYVPGPQTPFKLLVGPYPQFTGELDAIEVAGDDGSTSVSFRGRDLLARLHDCDIDADRSFENLSYQALVQEGLKDVGLGGRLIEISNEANLRVRTGARVKIFKQPIRVDEVTKVKTGGGEKVTVTAKMGEGWLSFIHRHIEKLGLFLWCTAQGGFVLSRPSADYEPLYTFVRERGQRRNVCNVTKAHFVNDTSKRFSEVVIFTRSGGRKSGRNHLHGGFEDQEMIDLGFTRRRVYRDVNVETPAEAAAYSARKIGEANRASWRLVYTVTGHSAPIGVGGERGVIVPDTVARVDDDELGIHENLYIESCQYKSPPRETIVTMMRPKDLVFGSFGDD